MEQFLWTILTLILGIVGGIGLTTLVAFIKGTNLAKKADKLIEEAKKRDRKTKKRPSLRNERRKL